MSRAPERTWHFLARKLVGEAADALGASGVLLIFMTAQSPTACAHPLSTHSSARELPAPRRPAKHWQESVNTSLLALQRGKAVGVYDPHLPPRPSRFELQSPVWLPDSNTLPPSLPPFPLTCWFCLHLPNQLQNSSPCVRIYNNYKIIIDSMCWILIIKICMRRDQLVFVLPLLFPMISLSSCIRQITITES